MSWALCNMEQKNRSNTTNASDATNATNHQTSRIKPVHLLGLLDLNHGAPSPSSSPFPTASVADSVEFTETNPNGIEVMEQDTPVIDQDAPRQAVMNDTKSDSDKEETPAGGVLSVPLNQVCIFHFYLKMQLFVFEIATFRTFDTVRKFENSTFRNIFFSKFFLISYFFYFRLVGVCMGFVQP